jgi:hypothetical protein
VHVLSTEEIDHVLELALATEERRCRDRELVAWSDLSGGNSPSRFRS